MRAGVAIAFFFVLAGACARFGTDSSESEPTQEDAGTSTKADANVVSDHDVSDHDAPPQTEAGADASAPLLPSGPIKYDRFDTFDDRDPIPSGGPMKWQQDHDEYVDTPDCSGGSNLCSQKTVLTSGEGTTYGHLETDLGKNTRVLRFDFSLKISTSNSDHKGQAQLASLAISNTRFLIFEVIDKVLKINDQETSDTVGVELGSAIFDQWARYELFFDLDHQVMEVHRDGLPFPKTLSIRDKIVDEPFELISARLGLTFMNNNDFQLQFDNVGIREIPTP